MLIGEFPCSMDGKGRLNFPAKLRDDLGADFIVSKSLDQPCLCAWPVEEWKKRQEKLRALPSSQAAMLQRYLFSTAAEVTPDKQGRIVIPQKLREFIGSAGEVVVIGSDTHCEIWSRAGWDEVQSDMQLPDMKALADMAGF